MVAGSQGAESLVKSKQRVADHGEVFTPAHIVNDMIDLVADEAHRIESRFLEPACGSGNFLVPVLERKLATAKRKYGSSEFEHRCHALLALMSVYGIEILADNLAECRANLLDSFTEHLGIAEDSTWWWAASAVLFANIVHGDALAMTLVTTTPRAKPMPITFAEWAYLGKGIYHRRDFRFDTLTQASSFSDESTLFGASGKEDFFTPSKDYGRLTVEEIAAGGITNV